MRKLKSAFALGLVLGACAVDEQLEASTQEVHGTNVEDATGSMRVATMRVAGCLATKIAPMYAITSRKCDVRVGDSLMFHTSTYGPAPTGTVQQVIPRPGTTVSNCFERDTCTDSSGSFGDLVVIRFTAPVSASPMTKSGIAVMHWRYPGSGAAGFEVGPNLVASPPKVDAILDTLDSSSDAPGWFETTNDNSDLHDEGGAFWFQGRVLGTLWDGGYDALDGNWQLYASVPRRLDWILSTINYTWRGTPVQGDASYTGTTLDSFGGASERVCQYACENASSCEAFNFTSSSKTCQLVTSVTGRVTSSGKKSAMHYGASTGKSGDVVGYVRNDGYTSVVHKLESGAIHEIYRYDDTWSWGGLPTHPSEPPIAGGKLSAYRRADDINVVLYRSTNGNIVEVFLSSTGWKTAVLATHAKGDPIGFVRGDGLSAVVYRTTKDFVELLHLEASGWVGEGLIIGGDDAFLESDPVPFVDKDGGTNIVYRAKSNRIVRLSNTLADPSTWSHETPSTLAGAPTPAGRPYGYTRKNGMAAIVYRTGTQKLFELRRTNSGWLSQDLTPPTGQPVIYDPVAYVRTDAVESIVFKGYDGHIREVTRSPAVQHWDLSAQYSIPPVLSEVPTVYQRKDVTDGVLYHLNGLYAYELSLSAFGWGTNNLTIATGEPLQ